MPVVGDASIIVRAITDKVKGDIAKAFKDAQPAIQAAGREHARVYADSFNSELSSSFSRGFGENFNSAGKDASNAGSEHGRSFASRFAGEVEKIDLGHAMASAMQAATPSMMQAGINAAQTTTTVVTRTVERGMADAGRSGGSAFGRFLGGEFAQSAMKASEAFTMLFAKGQIMGVGLAGLVSALSAVVSGLFAMASAAAQAAGALAVLPGTLSVVAQAAATVKLAFGGIGAALKAGLKPQLASTSSSLGATASQMYAVADAQKAVTRATQDVKQAEVDLLSAQRAMTAARQAAAESYQQLGFSAESAALSEQRAGLSLQDAKKALDAVRNLPPDNRARMEAELSYKEAELAYREAKDRSNDLDKQQKKANKNGIKGSDEVKAARQRIADAEQALIDKKQSLADAEERVRRAQEAVNQAQKEGTSAANAYQQALDKLTPSQQKFVKYLISIKDAFKPLKESVASGIFPPLQKAIDTFLGGRGLPIMQEQLHVTAGLLGEAALGIAKVFDAGGTTNRFAQFLKGNNDILAVFVKRGEGGESTLSKLVRLFLRVGIAIQPVTKRFAEWIKHLVDGWAKATRTTEGLQKMTDFFNKAGNRARLLGRIFKNLFGVIGGLGKAADDSGKGLLKSLNHYLQHLNKWVNSAQGQHKLHNYFKGVAKNLEALGRLARAIGRNFAQLGNNPGIRKFSDAVIPAVENVGDMADTLTKAGGKPLADFIVNMTTILGAFTDSEGIKTFFGVINVALQAIIKIAQGLNNVLDKVFGDGAGKKVFIFIGALAAAHRAVSLIFIVGKKLIGILVGGPLNAIKSLKKMNRTIEDSVRKMLRLQPRERPGSTETTTTTTTTRTVVESDTAATKAAGEKAGRDFVEGLNIGMRTNADIFNGGITSLFTQAKGITREQASLLGKQIVTGLNIGMRTAEPGLGPTLGARIRAAKPEVRVASESLATDIIRGLSAGIRAGGKEVDGAVRGLARSLVAAIKLQLGIKSPSTVFADIGHDAGRGLVVGLESEIKQAETAGRELGLAAARGVKSVPLTPNPVTPGVGAGAAGAGAGAAAKEAEQLGSKAAKSGGLIAKLGRGLGALSVALLGVSAPIAAIIAAIALFIGGLVLLYKHSPQFKKFVDGIVNKFKEFGKWIGNILEKYVLPLLDKFFGWVNKNLPKVGHAFGVVFGAIVDAIRTAFNFVKDHWELIIGILLGPIGPLVVYIIKHWKQIKDKTTDLFNAIKDFVNGAKKKWQEFKTKIGEVVLSVKKKFDELKQKVENIKQAFKTGFAFIGDFFGDKIQLVQDKLNSLVDFFRNLPQRLRSLGGAFKDAGKWIIDSLVNGLKKAGDIIGGIASSVWDVLKDLLNGAIDKINSALQFRIPIGFGKHINVDPPDIKHLAKGGVVPARPGGTLARIGEAGKSERVEPLDNNGLSQRDRAIVAALVHSMGGGRGDTLIVNPSKGMNEMEIAEYVLRKQRFGKRIGA